MLWTPIISAGAMCVCVCVCVCVCDTVRLCTVGVQWEYSRSSCELLARALEDCIAPAHSACLVHRCPGLPGMRDAVTNFALHVHV